MTAIFIPPSCKKIGQYAFYECKNLIIFNVPRHTQVGKQVISKTALSEKYLSINHRLLENKRKESNECMNCIRVIARSAMSKVFPSFSQNRIVTGRGGGFNEWFQRINADHHLELHRICSSFDPRENYIYAIIKEKGLCSLQEPNTIGLTPLEYLQANPFADIDQDKLLKLYVLELMGETVRV